MILVTSVTFVHFQHASSVKAFWGPLQENLTTSSRKCANSRSPEITGLWERPSVFSANIFQKASARTHLSDQPTDVLGYFSPTLAGLKEHFCFTHGQIPHKCTSLHSFKSRESFAWERKLPKALCFSQLKYNL